MKIVIVGGGVAAAQAAQSIRKTDGAASVVMLSCESVPPYRRPALSRMVAEELSDTQFFWKTASFYAENRIELRLESCVTDIEPAGHSLRLASGETLDYDRLILAVGARGVIPPLRDAGKFPPRLLRDYSDLQWIRHRLDEGLRSAVVMGGGLLGLELADFLGRRGVAVSVVESCPRLLPRQLSEKEAAEFQKKVEKEYPVSFVLGDEPKAFLADGVQLVSGRKVAGEITFAACGIRCRTELAKAAALDCDRGIRVDSRMRTSDSDIFAAGDCAEFEGKLFGLFLPARDMGKTAGINAAGGTAVFAGREYPVSWKGFGLSLPMR